jgi:hypothetical protein
VDCMLFFTYSEDLIFEVIARGHAATNGFCVSIAVPAQRAPAGPSAVIGPPHGYLLAQAPGRAGRGLRQPRPRGRRLRIKCRSMPLRAVALTLTAGAVTGP